MLLETASEIAEYLINLHHKRRGGSVRVEDNRKKKERRCASGWYA
jgi:hypothetical protein